MSEQIGRLCKLLEDVDTSNAQTNDSANPPPKNVKLMIFRLEQRIEEISRRIDNEIPMMIEEELCKKDEAPLQELSALPGEKDGSSHSNLQRRPTDFMSFKGLLVRQDNITNDLSLRLNSLETEMQKIEPNNIRSLFKDMAELVIEKQKKDVTAEMDNLKGSQLSNAQVVDKLKEQLKIMDEKFEKDIEGKIEKKDLTNCKNQLRRQLVDLENKLKGQDFLSRGYLGDRLPMMMYNSKCFFCNQEVKSKFPNY
jgi:hypothetical protein